MDLCRIESNRDCIHGDYVKVFMHLDSAAVNEYTPWETLLCGKLGEIPTMLYSSGPGLVLEFHSSLHTGNSSGFSGTFRFIDKMVLEIWQCFILILAPPESLVVIPKSPGDDKGYTLKPGTENESPVIEPRCIATLKKMVPSCALGES
ncbi:unnamed protein product [Phaedon cochleariae]|uniref:Uncharacterized protein n=1 Tax=Phaedon cochleariae TaxID=80249 RepID=A0A9N9SLW4_PHACE|nr:unnamed protein product [Phaedon cochleariae]